MSHSIKELWVDNFPNTEYVPDGYDMTTIPKATSQNMVVLVDKINELIEHVMMLEDEVERLWGSNG